MKKFLVIMIILFSCCMFTACADEVINSAAENLNMPEKPVSDVSGGTDLAGTWDSVQEPDENGVGFETVLALNSDNTFSLWQAIEGSENDVATRTGGHYEVEGDQLVFSDLIDENDYSGNGEEPDAESSVFDNNEPTFKLDGNTLTITQADGETIVFTRE